jgi:hypothetical protein
MRKIERISISAADRERLERLVRDRNTPQKVVWDGLTAEGIAAAVGKSLLTVPYWRRRYVAKGVDGEDQAGGAHDAAMECLDNHNADPKPFIWTKSAGQTLEKGARAKQALESQHKDVVRSARRSVLLGASEPVN